MYALSEKRVKRDIVIWQYGFLIDHLVIYEDLKRKGEGTNAQPSVMAFMWHARGP